MSRSPNLEEIDIPGLGKVNKQAVHTVMRLNGVDGSRYLLVAFTDGSCRAIVDDSGHAASIKSLGFAIQSPRLQKPLLGEETGDDLLRSSPSAIGIISVDASGQRIATVVHVDNFGIRLKTARFNGPPVYTETWKTVDELSKESAEGYLAPLPSQVAPEPLTGIPKKTKPRV